MAKAERESPEAGPGNRWGAFVLLGLCSLLMACQTGVGGGVFGTSGSTLGPPAAYRASGPRLTTFTGRDDAGRTWIRVDDVLWIDAEHRDAWNQGQIWDGEALRTLDQPSPRAAPDTVFLRTDHVVLHTNLSFHQAAQVAREAEGHVRRLIEGFGDVLDLRLPRGPLHVVCTRTRAEFQDILRRAVPTHVGWGAFYDGRDGVVYLGHEPATRGALPWQADLRHEMTHQVLDLSRPTSLRGRPFAGRWFWLWEGMPLYMETLGDGAGVDHGAARRARFAARLSRNEWTRWTDLMEMDASEFEGRHYDQTASMMSFLMDPAFPRRRAGVLDLVKRLLRGPVPPEQAPRNLGASLDTLQQAWLRSLAW